jgi:hypothetical protein
MAKAQKLVFVFRLNGQVHVFLQGVDSSVRYWQPGCARQLVAYLLLVAKTLVAIVKMSLQEGKKQAKRSGEREIMYNVHNS